jgi:hypothetical protein
MLRFQKVVYSYTSRRTDVHIFFRFSTASQWQLWILFKIGLNRLIPYSSDLYMSILSPLIRHCRIRTVKTESLKRTKFLKMVHQTTALDSELNVRSFEVVSCRCIGTLYNLCRLYCRSVWPNKFLGIPNDIKHLCSISSQQKHRLLWNKKRIWRVL